MVRNSALRGCAATVLVALAAASQAGIAYDNFGPGDSYDTTAGRVIAGSYYVETQQILACQFTSEADGLLDKIILPLQHLIGTDHWRVDLLNDDGDELGNFLFGTWSSGLPEFGSDAPPLVVNNPFDDPSLVLHAGSKYWLRVSTSEVPGRDTGADSCFVWNFNSTGATGLMAFSDDLGSTWNYRDDHKSCAFRVEVKPSSTVPGPLAVLPFALGLLVAWRRRR